jgi:glyoxylase-like metal-dependent hydrolase (beta-lactamase superfamily II)
MQSSLEMIMTEFGDDTLVFPGHGDNSTIGTERVNNPYLKNLRNG